jgi:hypothetical protein
MTVNGNNYNKISCKGGNFFNELKLNRADNAKAPLKVR